MKLTERGIEMKAYGVSIPVTGYVYLEVEAENEEEAKTKAFEHDFSTRDIEEWELHENICRGNVFYGTMNEIDVTEIDD